VGGAHEVTQRKGFDILLASNQTPLPPRFAWSPSPVCTGEDESSHCEERKRRRNPERHFRLDCFAPLAMTTRSRDAPEHPSYGKRCHVKREAKEKQVVGPAYVLRSSLLRNDVARMKRSEIRDNRSRFISLPGFAPLHPGYQKRKNRKQNADRRNQYSAGPDGPSRASHARRTSIGVPPRFSSRGVFHRKGLSTKPGFLGRGGQWSVLCAGVTRPACPEVQRAPRTPVIVPRD
jgi:hypothetical protein